MHRKTVWEGRLTDDLWQPIKWSNQFFSGGSCAGYASVCAFRRLCGVLHTVDIDGICSVCNQIRDFYKGIALLLQCGNNTWQSFRRMVGGVVKQNNAAAFYLAQNVLSDLTGGNTLPVQAVAVCVSLRNKKVWKYSIYNITLSQFCWCWISLTKTNN